MTEDKKILLTGFGPFRNHGENPSEILVQNLSTVFSRQSNIHTLILPTEYKRSWDMLEHAITDYNPDIVLSFGLAARRKHICLESTAFNSASTNLADASGYTPHKNVLITGAPSFYKSNLPLARIEKSLRNQGHKVRISRDAGDYVCNATLFKLLHHAKKEKPDMKATFIHIPKPRSRGLLTHESLQETAMTILDNV